jgi:competence protein ComEC
VTDTLQRYPQHLLLAAVCTGIALALAARAPHPAGFTAAAVAGAAALTGSAQWRLVLVGLALALAGWWWGSIRLDAIDRSVLVAYIGRGGRAVVTVTAPPRRGSFDLRIAATASRFRGRSIREPVLLKLPLGRAPPLGARLELVAQVLEPRPPRNGFDEKTYLRRHGIHVVLRASHWRVVGRRGGLGGLADRLHRSIAASLEHGTGEERRGLLLGVLLGDDSGLDEELRDRFRASGLYHLLAVSGQNVAFVAGAALIAGWTLGLARWVAELGALAAIGCYVLAVGPQPSVVRAGIAGALASLSWLAARERDRWYFLGVGALALLVWNPYSALDVGFQLSFAAVAAIFLVAPKIERFLEGYPMPGWLRPVLAISTACGVVTAPILWLQFGSVPVLTVVANALAAPAMIPLLGLAFAAAVVHPLAPGAGAALVWLAGWPAAYIAWCARLIGGLPGARVSAPWALALVAAGALGVVGWARKH